MERLNKASRCMAQKQWGGAAAAFDEVLKAQPDNSNALFGKAQLAMHAKRFKRAVELLEKAQKKLPPKEDATPINEWHVIGPFSNPWDGKGLNVAYPPEKEIKLDAAYDGQPGDGAACKAAMAQVRESCNACHAMCKGKGLAKAGMKGMPKMVYPKNDAEMTQFANGLNDLMSTMMVLKMACKPAMDNGNSGAVGAASYFAKIMKAVQARANTLCAANKDFVMAGKKFCTLCDAVVATSHPPKKVTWKKMNAGQAAALQNTLGPLGNVVFYGLANIDSDKDQTVELRVGSDDGCKVWLNDTPIWTHAVRRACNPDNDRMFVKLHKGKNKLLLKIEQSLGTYGMAAKIVRKMSVAGPLAHARRQWDKIKNQALVRLSADGLLPTSQRRYWIHKKSRCVKKAQAGRLEMVPPGPYTIRVGFPSGYVAKDFDLKKGVEFTVPTGLFTFKEVTPPKLKTTLPQRLYHLETGTYLTTAYQGDVARLFPGKYRVCYQDMNDATPSVAFGPWHVLGCFPNPSKAPKFHQGFYTAYPPEKEPIPDLKKTYDVGGRKIGWQTVDGSPQIDIASVIPNWGIAYATATLHSDADREVELVMTWLGGLKVWLNGEPIKTVRPPRRTYRTSRGAGFVRLHKGPNILFVKTPRQSGIWPLSAVAIRWKRYDVNLAADNK